MDICAIDTRSFDTMKSKANVAAIFIFGFGTGFVVCLLSVFNILPSLSGETYTTACDTYAGNRTSKKAVTLQTNTKLYDELYVTFVASASPR